MFLKKKMNRIKDIERNYKNIKISNILERVLSKYLLYGINNYENENYLNWADIPQKVYDKYKIDKNELQKLTIERNDEFDLESQDIYHLVAHYTFSDNKKNNYLIYNIVSIFYNLKTNSFKFDYLRKNIFNKVNIKYDSKIYNQVESFETLYDKTNRLSTEIQELRKKIENFD